MITKPSLKCVLSAAAGCGSLLTIGGLGACSQQIKVQRIEYEPPTQTAVIQHEDMDTNPDFEASTELTQATPLNKPLLAPLSTIEQVREALEAIYDLDAELVSSSMQDDPNRIHSLLMIAEFDRQHTQTLMTIIERFGWPTREMVGLKAVQGAYIAIQHAGHDQVFQSNCLALIQQQVDQGELPGAFLALMTDRVSVSRGESQVYGTQMTMAPDEFGVMRAVPSAAIWKEDLLNQRRAALGMPTHQRFIKAIEVAYFDSIKQSDSVISSVPTE